MPRETAAERAERERLEPPEDWAEQSVHSALLRVMRDLPVVGKEQRNEESPEQFMFRGVDAMVNAVGPLLRKHGVQHMPKVLKADLRPVGTDRGAAMVAWVRMRYTFHGPDGSKRKAEVIGEAMDAGDKALSKAQSVAWRVALIQVFAVPTGERDPDSFTYRRTEGGQRAASRPQGGQQGQQRRPGQGDDRQPLWDEIKRIGEAKRLSANDVRRMFARWSGGKQIDGKGVTVEVLCRFRDEEMNAPEPPPDYTPDPHGPDGTDAERAAEQAAAAALRDGLGAEPLPEGAEQ